MSRIKAEITPFALVRGTCIMLVRPFHSDFACEPAVGSTSVRSGPYDPESRGCSFRKGNSCYTICTFLDGRRTVWGMDVNSPVLDFGLLNFPPEHHLSRDLSGWVDHAKQFHRSLSFEPPDNTNSIETYPHYSPKIFQTTIMEAQISGACDLPLTRPSQYLAPSPVAD